jgi:2-haloacid dehalogenase
VPLNRREFVYRMAGTLGVPAAALVTSVASASRVRPDATRALAPIRAVLFDAFPVFDPRSVETTAESEFPSRGTALTALWRTRQFEYTWLRTASQDYADFWQCTEDALRFACASLNIQITTAQRDRLMNAYLTLRPWPDAMAALLRLKQRGLRLGFLSNFTPAMLDAAIDGSRLRDIFDPVLSTDRARTYKPDPRAYQLGIDALGLPREQVLFVAFAGWDAAGAARFGYLTYWVNRMRLPPEALGHVADGVGYSLDDVSDFLAARS